MIRLYCGENLLEYAGDGWFQCGRHVTCPKKHNNKIIGFDCIVYIDNLPEGVKLAPEEESSDSVVAMIPVDIAKVMAEKAVHV